MIAKIWQKGHTWGNHGYDAACIVNQMTVGSWIGFNSMTSRFILQPISAIYMICCCTYKFDEVCMCSPFFSSKIYRKIWTVLTCCEALACLIFQTNPVDWLKGDCYEMLWNLFEFDDIILVWVLSSFVLQVLDRRWKMPKLQVPDVRCKFKGCWCLSVGSMMFVGRFRADL